MFLTVLLLQSGGPSSHGASTTIDHTVSGLSANMGAAAAAQAQPNPQRAVYYPPEQSNGSVISTTASQRKELMKPKPPIYTEEYQNDNRFELVMLNDQFNQEKNRAQTCWSCYMSLLSTSGDWKSVELPGDVIERDKEFQFLSAFEEIFDYEIKKDDQKKSSGEGRKKDNKIKSKKSKLKAEEKNTSTDVDIVEKKKGSKKSKKKVESVDVDDDLNIATSSSASDIGQPLDLSQWEELEVMEPILKVLVELGFIEPTAIQKLAIPAATKHKLDIIGAAETGSGKTLAFGIPIVSGLLTEERTQKGLYALVMTPTRELALQIKSHITAILKYTLFRIAAVVGGLSVLKQERILKRKPEILVATPGRLWAMMEQAVDNEYFSDLTSLKYLVVDETDRMVEKGHFEELTNILEKLNSEEHRNPNRQTLVFSATLTFVHPAPRRLDAKQMTQMTIDDKIENLVSLTGVRKKHKVIDITREFGTAETLTETRINCSNLQEKDVSLCYFLTRYPDRTLIFTNSIDCSRRLYGLLTKLGFSSFMLHARMHQKQRLKNLERFTEVPNSILLATDVAARGLDIKSIEHVVHYQVPKTAEVYVHRSGRTARATKEGLSLMLIDPNDAAFYRRICRNLNREHDLPLFPIDSPGLMSQLKDRVYLAASIDSLEYKIKKSSSRQNWFLKAAEEADLDFEEIDIDHNMHSSSADATQMKADLKSLQKQLKFLLSKPLVKTSELSTRYPTFEMVQDYGSKPTDALNSVKMHKSGDKRKLVFKDKKSKKKRK